MNFTKLIMFTITRLEKISNFRKRKIIYNFEKQVDIAIHVFMLILLSSSYVNSMYSFDSLPPSIPIGHHSWQVLYTASIVCTEQMHESLSWSYNTGGSIYRNPWENFTNEFISTLSKFCTWVWFTCWITHESESTWASGREDYMHIGAFHNVQVVSSIPNVVIGCELKRGYASMHISWPAHRRFLAC